MPTPISTLRQAAKLRLYGVVFIAVIALLLSLSVAVYQKAFTPSVPITLQAGTIGNQLEPRADVKVRGLLVGEVREVRADGDKATLDIALDPDHVERIPADVTARLLPKTLFGEKYVDLVVPDEVSGEHISSGDVITQDRTAVGMELQKLMNDLLPLLRAVQPAKLNATLSAFATALEGRGDEIGGNLVRLERYLSKLNPHLPSMEEDIRRFADVTEIYGDAAPDLLRTLRNTVTTSKTLVEKQDALASVLTGTTTMAGTAEKFLDDNGERMITLGRVSRPTLALLARYSPEYPCLLKGLTQARPFAEETLANEELHITLEVAPPRPAYKPGEEPDYSENAGPSCYGLPDPQRPFMPPRLEDGSDVDARYGKGPLPGNASGTEDEQRVIGSLVSPVMGVPADEVPPVATLLMGPMFRGTEVNVA